MFCQNCGGIQPDNAEFCSICGKKFDPVIINQKYEQTQPAMQNAAARQENTAKPKDDTNYVLLVVFALLAAVVVVMFFMAANEVAEAAEHLMHIRSISGTSVAESYYNDVGAVYLAFATALRATGIVFAAVLLRLGIK